MTFGFLATHFLTRDWQAFDFHLNHTSILCLSKHMRSLQIEDDMEDFWHLLSISMEERVADTGVTDRIWAKKTSSTPTVPAS